MRNFCGELRRLVCESLKKADIQAEPSRVFLGCDECALAYALHERNIPKEAPPCLHPWIERTEIRQNRILFFLSDAFYREASSHILKEKLSDLPPTIEGEVPYARARMCMLARKGGELFDESLKSAFCFALFAREEGLSPKAAARKREMAARLALFVNKDETPRERWAFRSRCGLAAGCIARLLTTGEDTSVDTERTTIWK